MATLILTEKPSVARDFAKALGIQGRGDGFMEGAGYVITWAVGHLVELAEPGDYGSQWKGWNLASLPILPDHLKYKPIPNVEKQLRIVQKQLKRSDIERIVIATDAGREGEVIARTILQTVDGMSGSIYRFWTSQALTTQVVRETLKSLRSASEYDRLWDAGQARQIADWLVGMNLSRAATLKLRRSSKDTFSVGRVQTAVLALLVDRKVEREKFNPEPYWVLRVNFSNPKGNWWGTWFEKNDSRFNVKEDAEKALSSIQGQAGRVKSVKREKKKQPPPMLYSLTDLQRDANSKFGFSAQQTLDVAQKLYEQKKCLSYPRTDSKVLGSQNLELVKRLVGKLSSAYPDVFQSVESRRLSLSNKRVFNDAKLTDHHALIPLAPLPKDAQLNEKQIYELVLKRFAAVFHPDYEYEATEVITEVTRETFRTKGNRPLVLGWKAVYGHLQTKEKGDGSTESEPSKGDDLDDEGEEQELPLLERNDPAEVGEAKLEEKLTQPPPDYTEALLLRDMTNPSRYVSEAELQKIFKGDVGLGTQATRAQIIETLLKRLYVVREKKKLIATEKGCFLIKKLRQFQRAKAIARPEETARWEMELEKIAQGIGNPEAFMAEIRKFVEDGVEEFKMSEKLQMVSGSLGKCPACGGEIVVGKKGYGCKNWREQDGGCRFVVWKEIAGSKIEPEVVQKLLQDGTSPALQFRSKEGKEFTAALKLEEDKEAGKWLTRFVFSGPKVQNGENGQGNDASGTDIFGQCPRCGGDVVEGKKGFGCTNWREQDGGCRFVIWKVIAGNELTHDQVRELLGRKETDVINGFISRKGTPFSARLRLEGEDFKTNFVF